MSYDWMFTREDCDYQFYYEIKAILGIPLIPLNSSPYSWVKVSKYLGVHLIRSPNSAYVVDGLSFPNEESFMEFKLKWL